MRKNNPLTQPHIFIQYFCNKYLERKKNIMYYYLNEFNMSSIKDDKVVMFIGKRETGKSFLVKDLLWHHKDLPVGTVISGTEGANQFYSKTIPPIFIHDEYTPGIIDNFCKRQKKLVNKKVMGDPEYQDVDPRAFLILDDCLSAPLSFCA